MPADLAAVVARAMAKSPLDLVPSTHELKTLLGLRGAAADANAPAWL